LWPHRLGTEESAVKKCGAEIFNKANFKAGGKFAPPEEANSLEAKYFKVERIQEQVLRSRKPRSAPTPSSTTGKGQKTILHIGVEP
jgi:hypothetical protein